MNRFTFMCGCAVEVPRGLPSGRYACPCGHSLTISRDRDGDVVAKCNAPDLPGPALTVFRTAIKETE